MPNQALSWKIYQTISSQPLTNPQARKTRTPHGLRCVRVRGRGGVSEGMIWCSLCAIKQIACHITMGGLPFSILATSRPQEDTFGTLLIPEEEHGVEDDERVGPVEHSSTPAIDGEDDRHHSMPAFAKAFRMEPLSRTAMHQLVRQSFLKCLRDARDTAQRPRQHHKHGAGSGEMSMEADEHVKIGPALSEYIDETCSGDYPYFAHTLGKYLFERNCAELCDGFITLITSSSRSDHTQFLPTVLEEIVMYRVDKLGQHSQVVLNSAAVLGTFSLELLHRVVQSLDSAMSMERMQELVTDLQQQRFLSLSSGGGDGGGGDISSHASPERMPMEDRLMSCHHKLLSNIVL